MSKEAREKHQQTHQHRFMCSHEGCDYSILGFSTGNELAKHLPEHTPASDRVVFPSVQRSSLPKSLADAIDKDDYLSAGALSTELSALPTREFCLWQALKKRKYEAAKAIAQILRTQRDLNYQEKSGKMAIHLVAECGDEEMAKIIVEMGADINVMARNLLDS